MMKYYALLQNIYSEEYHIREYKKEYDYTDEKWKYYPVSRKMCCGEFVDNKFSSPLKIPVDGKNRHYFTDTEMRHICAEIGRRVCGQCVATLYASKDENGNWLF